LGIVRAVVVVGYSSYLEFVVHNGPAVAGSGIVGWVGEDRMLLGAQWGTMYDSLIEASKAVIFVWRLARRFSRMMVLISVMPWTVKVLSLMKIVVCWEVGGMIVDRRRRHHCRLCSGEV
jgi:hypothetical protein